MTNELADYMAISINAVGGIETEAGQEMKRLLMERASMEVVAQPKTAEKVKEPEPADQGGGILGDELMRAFETVIPGQPT